MARKASSDLSSTGHFDVVYLAVLLTLAAVAGKLAWVSLSLTRGPSPWIVGLSMVPRGEVGLVFAGLGASLMISGQSIRSPQTYSAVVAMVVATTLLPPLFLAKLLRASADREGH